MCLRLNIANFLIIVPLYAQIIKRKCISVQIQNSRFIMRGEDV